MAAPILGSMNESVLYVVGTIAIVGVAVLFSFFGPYYETGIASWYGPGFDGNLTANGEVYDMHGISAAHKTLPFGTIVRVVDLDTGRSIVVRSNERGPFIEGRLIVNGYELHLGPTPPAQQPDNLVWIKTVS